MSWSFCVQLRWEVIVHFVDIGGIDDHHCLNFLFIIVQRGRRGCDQMVVGFTTTYAISAYHHWCCDFESRSGWGVQHYVRKFVSDLGQNKYMCAYCHMSKKTRVGPSGFFFFFFFIIGKTGNSHSRFRNPTFHFRNFR